MSSQAHTQCSESFYKKELETQIKSEPSKSMEERRNMMELLKRFEEESAEDTAALEEEEGQNDDDDLANRLETLDIDHASYDEIWSALTPAERDKFMKALGDPTSDLAQQLLSSEELEKQIIEPWWERSLGPNAEYEDASIGVHGPGQRRYGERPSPLHIPSALANTSTSPTSGNGPSLLFNISAVLLAYAYTTRHFSTSPLSKLTGPDRVAARQTLSSLVPFLAGRKSTVVLPTMSGMVTDVWSRFEPGTITAKVFSVLLRDASKLVRPVLVAPISSAQTTNPNHGAEGGTHLPHNQSDSDSDVDVLLAFGDIAALFKTPNQPPHIGSDPPKKESHSHSHVAHKLTFYAARVAGTPTLALHLLAAELAARADAVEREGIEAAIGQRDLKSELELMLEGEGDRRIASHGGGSEPVAQAFIEELS
ncbi:hypothetical protein EUX98_g6390 [Antrodiella citrinella]|uniref:Uncharacterized protein n=1 Tax=Antrodiella citrinella TaxID=2447956 RepID=A0A4V3XI42_9APHY|nr:hypothetical protein EUX98_g6390 [Antrodiella citrinella]